MQHNTEPTKELSVLGQGGKFVSQSQKGGVYVLLPSVANLNMNSPRKWNFGQRISFLGVGSITLNTNWSFRVHYHPCFSFNRVLLPIAGSAPTHPVSHTWLPRNLKRSLKYSSHRTTTLSNLELDLQQVKTDILHLFQQACDNF